MSIEKIIDPNKNLFIEASAGTGKTYTIQQIVAQLIDEGCPLKKILIVTYTEKAAGELKDRIRKKLEDVLDSSSDNETIEKFEKALREVDDASIFTIHSFCQKALTEYAYDAGRPFNIGMIEEKDVQNIVLQWIRDKWPQDPLFKEILKTTDNVGFLEKKFVDMLVSAINLYKGCDEDSGEELVILDSVSGKEITKAPNSFEDLEEIEGFSENFKILNKYKQLPFSKKKTVEDFIATISQWSQGNELFNARVYKKAALKEWPDEPKKAFEFFSDLKDTIKDLSQTISENQKNAFLYSQIKPLFKAWQEFKRKQKVQTFNDMILSVHKAVLSDDNNGKNGGLCKTLRSQYSFAIIDEFQDTNQLQWDIFKKLFLNVKDHSIFVVGDPKQSIYSFQGADVNVYYNATAEIKNRKDLEHNYRSTNSIIEACNRLFANPSFFNNTVEFRNSYAPGEKPDDNPESKKAQKPSPLVYIDILGIWEECKAIFVSEKNVDKTDYAQTCVEKIIHYCSFVNTPEGPRTRLQVFNKNAGKYKGRKGDTHRDVTFKDFAILARTRSEMEIIENAMKNVGVPFTRYKDDKLFYGRECAEWISLFKAINATDFSSWNRLILNEVLTTDFFAIPANEVESDYFDDPMSEQRQMINRWRALAGKRRFAEMQECIYNESNIEKCLMDLSQLQNLTKLRQIGNYAINYLYNHDCTLTALIRHLQGLANSSADVDEQDENLVSKGTDFDAVQVMTIHASKGLEFPIVISVAGFKRLNSHSSGPFLYHENGKVRLGFSDKAKGARLNEEHEEWSRLFYVNFTRASSILILPHYSSWFEKDGQGVKEDFKFLASTMDAFCTLKNAELYETMPTTKKWNFKKKERLKQSVQKHILTPVQELQKQEQIIDDETEESQKERIAKLQKDTRRLSIAQHSYSSLAGKVDSNVSIDGENINKEGLSESGSNLAAEEFDFAGIPTSLSEAERHEVEIHYPRGSKIGNALHSIFELIKFHEFGQNHPTEESIYDSTELTNTVEEMFKKQSLPIWNHKEEWTRYTLHILWNTLNANFPAIEAGKLSGTQFKLTSIAPYQSKAEAQFNLNATSNDNGEASEYLQNICKGYIDLMFMRKDSEGNMRYSILDWKSDFMPNGNYSPEKIRKKVDKEYSVQRVLYSYCLIKWLKQFYAAGATEGTEGQTSGKAPLSEAEIFDKYFGGIYYVFIRGCKADSSNGIYAHTWENFEELQKSYKNLQKIMTKPKNKMEEN